MIKKIGIECESIEGKNPMWGVGRIIMKLLEEISRRPELEKNYRFILYFKDNVSDFPFLKAPIFETKLTPVPFFKNRLFPIYYFALLPMRLWFDRPDVMFWPNYMLPIVAFGKSLVMLTEDVYYETHDNKPLDSAQDKLPFRYRLAYRVFCWWAAKFATKIMAISEASRKNLTHLYHIDPDRIVVNRLGTDLNQNAKIKIQNDNPKFKNNEYVLFVGQMFPRRHAKETILAFENIFYNSNSQTLENLRITDLKLFLIGPDKYEIPTISSLIKKVNERLGHEAIIHKDYVNNEELTELYSGAKALIYVSDKEAFGLPPMEALAFGVPPVIMDNELGHELFENYAFYSKSGNVDDIAEAIRQALNEAGPSTALRASRLEFVKKYNWKNFADRFLDIVKL